MAEIVTNIDNSCVGKVHIADDVIATIAGTAAMEIEGIAAMAGNISDIAELLGKKNLSKGVKVTVLDDAASFELNIFVKNGFKIPEICEKVQEKVKTAVETMTGLCVSEVNINVNGLTTEKTISKKDSKLDF
jgi:uncharacterized alkaline shock family protein YloU